MALVDAGSSAVAQANCALSLADGPVQVRDNGRWAPRLCSPMSLTSSSAPNTQTERKQVACTYHASQRWESVVRRFRHGADPLRTLFLDYVLGREQCGEILFLAQALVPDSSGGANLKLSQANGEIVVKMDERVKRSVSAQAGGATSGEVNGESRTK